jgi:hypothetical protein
MALTEKGQMALGYINKYYPDKAFTAKELSDKCGVKIVGATLNSIVNNGYLTKLSGSPVQYQTINDFAELIKAMEEEENSKGCTNTNLCEARKNKNDEFYTRYDDIEAEVMKYRKQFKDKVVYLPCDDPAEKKSEFWSFFVNNFDAFGLKKLIATHYDESGKAYKIWIDGDTSNDGFVDDGDAVQEDLQGNGDFQSPECVAIMNECDIVCTNPPFSLFRSFVDTIMKAGKKFLIIGNQNAFTYKEIFKLIKENKIWTGYNMVKQFNQPDGSIKKFGNVCWFTNMTTVKRNEEFVLTKEYNPINYPEYENYKAIEVDRIVNIPKDYYDVMGVPITFIDKYNPNQFEILGHTSSSDKSPEVEELRTNPKYRNRGLINGKEKYDRVLIRRKKI